MERSVVALFDTLDTAQTAVQELLNNGFSRDDVSVVRTNQQTGAAGAKTAAAGEAADDARGAAAGAGIGAVLGGLAGLLVGLGALAIPGIGPIIAAGPLATALAGAGLGAATGGLVGALADAGVPEREAGYYAEGIRRGGTLVTVRASEEQVSQATEILNRYTPVDINQRATEWQSSGWTGHDANDGPYSTSSSAPRTQQAAEMGASTGSSPLTKSSGGYRAETGLTGENSGGTYEGTGSAGYTGSGTTYQGSGSFTSNTERSNTGDATRDSEWHNRESAMGSGHGEMSTSEGFTGQGGGTDERMRDTVSGAQLGSSEGDYQARRDFGGVESERQGETGAIETGHGTYGSQGQNFESSQGHAMEGQRRFEDYDTDFRSDWASQYRNSGLDYSRYQPAYQYGWRLGDQNQGREWSDLEASARSDWERSHPNDAWPDFKNAVQHAWQRVRSDVRDTLE